MNGTYSKHDVRVSLVVALSTGTDESAECDHIGLQALALHCAEQRNGFVYQGFQFERECSIVDEMWLTVEVGSGELEAQLVQ